MIFRKDPDAVLDYRWDWEPWLTAEGDLISTSTFIVPTGITKDSDSKTTTATTIWLSGGTAGIEYEVTNRIVTTGGRTNDRTVVISVQDQ